ncbi:hypothetical protein B4135_3782 [Caldibacillus debilis]|uniref:Uncharacterized protein n=1 Tax=Caldibacillus debilis TaxID=301148 RepID=A0A150LAT8_9BACI|nr:hypothetical protein B4135_3782 [Caldibacillus debilis]
MSLRQCGSFPLFFRRQAFAVSSPGLFFPGKGGTGPEYLSPPSAQAVIAAEKDARKEDPPPAPPLRRIGKQVMPTPFSPPIRLDIPGNPMYYCFVKDFHLTGEGQRCWKKRQG